MFCISFFHVVLWHLVLLHSSLNVHVIIEAGRVILTDDIVFSYHVFE